MSLRVCQSCAEQLVNGETEDAEYPPLSTVPDGVILVVDLESAEFTDWKSCDACPQSKAGQYYTAEELE